MHATAYTATAEDTRITVTIYRDGAAPERISEPFTEDAHTTTEDAQAQAERMLSARGLATPSGWEIVPDPDRPDTGLLVWWANLEPAPAL